MQMSKSKLKVAGGALATSFAALAFSATPAMAGWVTAPCSWTGSRIQCTGATMSGQGRSGNYASADAKYAGGVLYQVSCTISPNRCKWIRIY